MNPAGSFVTLNSELVLGPNILTPLALILCPLPTIQLLFPTIPLYEPRLVLEFP